MMITDRQRKMKVQFVVFVDSENAQEHVLDTNVVILHALSAFRCGKHGVT